MRFRAAPTDADGDGHVHGGRVMRCIDDSGLHVRNVLGWAHVLSSYVAGIRFYRPVIVGDAVEVTARVIHTGPRSVHVSVHVTTTDAHCGPPHLAAHGLAVVVALDEHGNARPVRQWQPVSDEDQSAR